MAQLKATAAEHRFPLRFRAERSAVKHDSRARLRIRSLPQYQQCAARAVRSLTKAKPGRQWNPHALCWIDTAQIQHQRRKSPHLQQQVSGPQRLIEMRPVFLCAPDFCRGRSRAAVRAANPQQQGQMHTACRSRFWIERIACIHPGADLPTRCTTGQKSQRQRCSSRALRADHLADGTHGQAAIEQCIDSGNAGRRRLAESARHGRERRREAGREGFFDLES